MAKKFNIEKFNQILKEHNQQLYAKNITGKEVVLSNGLILTSEKEVRLFKRRVMLNDSVWKENFDRIYGTDGEQRLAIEKECDTIARNKGSIKGGINCQKLHGEKIRKNLNTGVPWSKDKKLHYEVWNKGKTKYDDERLLKLSQEMLGEQNPSYGRKYTEEERRVQSQKMRELILSGKFTPNSNNRNTHWESVYKDKKYRSSWEALYQYFDNDAEYETLRIPYKFDNKDYIYIIDFVNHKTKTVIEVKPQECLGDKKTQEKIFAAKRWSDKNGYTFIIVDKNYLLSRSMPSDLLEFDIKTQNKIRRLYETGK